MPGKIPDRWEAYTAMGAQIEGTRFITFKVPLKVELLRTMPEDEHFSPDILLQRIQEQGKELGLIIDLTNTHRYYNPACLRNTSTQHVKIKTEGHVVPSRKVQRKFFRAVDRFLQENTENNMLVGVHCTHGLNRTGYLVCRYMIDRLGMAPDAAIEAYNTARGHSIERVNYLEDLKAPSTPIALDEEDDEEDEEEAAANNHNGYGGGWGRGRPHQRPFHHQRRFDERQNGNGSRNGGDWSNNGGRRKWGGQERSNGHWGGQNGGQRNGWGQGAEGNWRDKTDYGGNDWYQQQQWGRSSWGGYDSYPDQGQGQWQGGRGSRGGRGGRSQGGQRAGRRNNPYNWNSKNGASNGERR